MRRTRKDYLVTQYEMLVFEPVETQRKSSGFGGFVGFVLLLAIVAVVVGALTGGQASKKSALIPDTARIDDAVRAGSAIAEHGRSPLASLVLAQRVAVALARARNLDPDHPHSLTRSVVLP